MNVKKYKVDDNVFYEPFKNDEFVNSEILKNISKKSVILSVYDKQNNKYEIYDYEICILETGEIKKVKESVLSEYVQ
ncbi:MAG: hypothetical protein ACW97P_03390 [Candidatus Hodarchaeales archaeon]|jgi:hypothetical protein